MREIRDRNFTVRLSQTEYEKLCKMADKLNLTAGAYIRYIIFNE